MKKLCLNKETLLPLSQSPEGLQQIVGGKLAPITFYPACGTGCVCATGVSCGIACVYTVDCAIG